jgi:hypothetical protein
MEGYLTIYAGYLLGDLDLLFDSLEGEPPTPNLFFVIGDLYSSWVFF